MHASFPTPGRRAGSFSRGRCRWPLFQQRGFTILEVVFAATVMIFAITTSITAMQRAFLALDLARKVTLSGQIMQSEFERLRLEKWDTIATYPATSDISTAAKSGFDGNSAAIVSTFTITRSVTDAHADMKLITITTTFRSYDGMSHTRSYFTYYGKNGLYDYFYNSY